MAINDYYNEYEFDKDDADNIINWCKSRWGQPTEDGSGDWEFILEDDGMFIYVDHTIDLTEFILTWV